MIQIAWQGLEKHPVEGQLEIVPAFTTLTVFYDPLKLTTVSLNKSCSPFIKIKKKVLERIKTLSFDSQVAPIQRRVAIPVCYGGEFGPDLKQVAHHHQRSIQKVIELHKEPDYLVYMIGFAPGFPYLGGLNASIHTPRRARPRLHVPKGSVGIAEGQTGIYPFESPGGWQIIGRTPLSLFDAQTEPPSLLHAGDTVHFYPISESEYWEIEKGGLQPCRSK